MLLRFPAGTQDFATAELLLLHKPRKHDAWQLPQGGAENDETAQQCAVRELQEEAGIDNAEILGKSAHVYQYEFPPSYRRFRPDHICGQRIEYVFGIVPADTVVTVDQKEVDQYRWVAPRDIAQYMKRKEYMDLLQSLLDEAKQALAART